MIRRLLAKRRFVRDHRWTGAGLIGAALTFDSRSLSVLAAGTYAAVMTSPCARSGTCRAAST